MRMWSSPPILTSTRRTKIKLQHPWTNPNHPKSHRNSPRSHRRTYHIQMRHLQRSRSQNPHLLPKINRKKWIVIPSWSPILSTWTKRTRRGSRMRERKDSYWRSKKRRGRGRPRSSPSWTLKRIRTIVSINHFKRRRMRRNGSNWVVWVQTLEGTTGCRRKKN